MLDTFRPVPFASEMAISKSVAWLNEQLEMGNDRLLLMDCRPQELYESSHIESAINVAIPGIMLRRLQKGNLPLRSLVSSSEEDRERFARRCGTDTVVLYDEHSRDWNENTGGESVLGLLLKRLKDEGCKAFYLEGEKGRLGLGRWWRHRCLLGGPGLWVTGRRAPRLGGAVPCPGKKREEGCPQRPPGIAR